MIEEIPDWERPQTTRDLPRWLQIASGLFLGTFTIFCAYASVVMLFNINKKAPILAAVVAIVLLLGCAWVLEKCLRLLTGEKSRGGLLNPITLRVVSYSLLLFIVTGLFTGYYRTMGPIAIYQAAIYFSSFFGLQRLAHYRESQITSPQLRDPDSNPTSR